MKLRKIACPSCGAPIMARNLRSMVTCAHCSSHLSLSPEAAPAGSQPDSSADTHIELLQLQIRLERVERTWNTYREASLIRGQYGATREPSSHATSIGGYAALVGAGFFTILAVATSTWGMLLVSFVLLCVGCFLLTAELDHARGYETVRRNYLRERESLTARIRMLQNGSMPANAPVRKPLLPQLPFRWKKVPPTPRPSAPHPAASPRDDPR